MSFRIRNGFVLDCDVLCWLLDKEMLKDFGILQGPSLRVCSNSLFNHIWILCWTDGGPSQPTNHLGKGDANTKMLSSQTLKANFVQHKHWANQPSPTGCRNTAKGWCTGQRFVHGVASSGLAYFWTEGDWNDGLSGFMVDWVKFKAFQLFWNLIITWAIDMCVRVRVYACVCAGVCVCVWLWVCSFLPIACWPVPM